MNNTYFESKKIELSGRLNQKRQKAIVDIINILQNFLAEEREVVSDIRGIENKLIEVAGMKEGEV